MSSKAKPARLCIVFVSCACLQYSWFLAFAAGWHLLVYCTVTRAIADTSGFLAQLGVADFAGGTFVHTASGFSSLMLAVCLRRKRAPTTAPHNLPLVLLSSALLLMGWIGFTAGSALSAGYGAARALVATHLGGCVGMLTWGALEVLCSEDGWMRGRPTAVGAACGLVTGLVALTPSGGFVQPIMAIPIAVIVCAVVFFAGRLMRRSGLDDQLECFSIHGVGGVVGTLCTGLFATSTAEPGGPDGAFYGNPVLLAKQLAAVAFTVGVSVVGTGAVFAVIWLLARAMRSDLLLPDDIEAKGGADTLMHGERAYYWTFAEDAAQGEDELQEDFEADDGSPNGGLSAGAGGPYGGGNDYAKGRGPSFEIGALPPSPAAALPDLVERRNDHLSAAAAAAASSSAAGAASAAADIVGRGSSGTLTKDGGSASTSSGSLAGMEAASAAAAAAVAAAAIAQFAGTNSQSSISSTSSSSTRPHWGAPTASAASAAKLVVSSTGVSTVSSGGHSGGASASASAVSSGAATPARHAGSGAGSGSAGGGTATLASASSGMISVPRAPGNVHVNAAASGGGGGAAFSTASVQPSPHRYGSSVGGLSQAHSYAPGHHAHPYGPRPGASAAAAAAGAQRKLLQREMASLEQRKAAARAMTAYTLHEIRVPMQSLALGLQEIQYELSGCEACGRKAGLVEVLSCMHLASTQMERVMDSVLTWEKMEAGKFTLEFSPMSLPQLLKVAAMQIQRRVEEEGALLTVDVDPRVPRAVLGDFHRLLQIVLNVSGEMKVAPAASLFTLLPVEPRFLHLPCPCTTSLSLARSRAFFPLLSLCSSCPMPPSSAPRAAPGASSCACPSAPFARRWALRLHRSRRQVPCPCCQLQGRSCEPRQGCPPSLKRPARQRRAAAPPRHPAHTSPLQAQAQLLPLQLRPSLARPAVMLPLALPHRVEGAAAAG